MSAVGSSFSRSFWGAAFFVGGFPLEAEAGSGYEGGLILGDGV